MDDRHAPSPDYRISTGGAEPEQEETSSNMKPTFLTFTGHVVPHWSKWSMETSGPERGKGGSPT